MRLPLTSAAILCGVILLSGCTSGTPTAAPTKSATPTPTSLTQAQEVAKQTKTLVNLYSPLVCTNLADRPDIDLNEAVDKVLDTYATQNLNEKSRVELAHRVLEESAAKSCPEQSDRISEQLEEQAE